MRQVVLASPQNIETFEVALQKPALDMVVAKTLLTGICGTDVHSFFGETIFGNHFPFHIGHEVCARVVQIGSAVTNIAPEDIIAVNPFFTCGACPACYQGMDNNCEHKTTIGLQGYGGFSEYVYVPGTSAFKVNSEDYAAISLTEPLATVIYGLDKLHVDPTKSIRIVGIGTIGLMFLQLIRGINPESITVVDLNKNKLAKALELGADYALCPLDEDYEAQNAALRGQGYDVIIDCTGSIKSMHACIQEIGFGGQVLLFGLASANATFEINPFQLYKKDVAIFTSFALNKRSFGKAATLIEKGKLNTQILIDRVVPLAELEKSIREIASGSVDGKIIIDMNQ